jgi:small subunit ribosomal protein S6e
VQKVVSGDHAQALLKKKIGDKISGDAIGFPGYEFEITGGSDYCGFPMRRDVRGTVRKRVLIVSGVGIRKNVRGRKIRKTVAANTVYSKTAQINLKILKQGEKPITEEKKEGEAGEKAKEKKETPVGAKEKEAPEKKEEKKAEAKEEKKSTTAP